ncbi:MAG: phosphodiester glycosidase family protein [Candidatus Eremiobacteraeota bacterium]|nr:phosphodiester glycosidase family protein [Candidatus Eremiobacteraeota bacterium]MBC5803740.1 phosphodiester glycosidase family protein [Candidatus Eremiobacteraeota bacterium]MBC5820442.1 phosphodiester glycosidase family protein [Candidatus Eremiobacteraeota bacterium]
MIGPSLPAELAPPAPFPLVIAQSRTQEVFAPGMRRATYRLTTSDGPLVVNVVALDLGEPNVRLGVVLSHDRLISAGETVSSMARRTGAVAGINGDYFDIGQTNQPLNIVVRDGVLLRTPSQRVALDVRRDRSVHFDSFSFNGTVEYGAATIPLTGVDEWPPQGGASVLGAAFGAMRAAFGVTAATLVPADALHGAELAGAYRVAAIGPADAQTAHGIVLGLGPAAQTLAPPPAPGDGVTIAMTTTPPLSDVVSALGGGPLLLQGGHAVDDPNAPAPEERNVRFPVAGAATTAAQTLLLVSVDGRNAATSIGVTRPQFAALLRGLGASDAMAFDSGGSATLVARQLGDGMPKVLGSPSDGSERPVADGLFAYSDAPLGPPAMLVARPSSIVALSGAGVPVRLAVVDAAGHLLASAPSEVLQAGPESGEVALHARGLVARVPIRVVERLARLDIQHDERAVDPGGTVHLGATGYDASGAVVQLGNRVQWSADRGAFTEAGVYRASNRDARIVARAGGLRTDMTLHVGSRRIALPLFEPQLTLVYDLSGTRRIATADVRYVLPGEPLQFSVDVNGDGGGATVRAAFVNRFGERRALTIAKNVDWTGWRTRTIAVPADLNPPVRLSSLYVVPPVGTAGAIAASAPARGTLGFRNPSVVVAGTP